ITAANRGPEAAVLHLLPTLWFRNTWSWGCSHEGCWPRPFIRRGEDGTLRTQHLTLGRFRLAAKPLADGTAPAFLFTENETNAARLSGGASASAYAKDAFHEYVVSGRTDAVNPKGQGTKAAAYYHLPIRAAGQVTFQLRLFAEDEAPPQPFGPTFDQVLADRIREADEFYAARIPQRLADEERSVPRPADAGLLWTTP